MTLAALKSLLEGVTGFTGKVVYNAWPVGAAPALPFICYLETRAETFGADGTTFFSKRAVDIELYSKARDLSSEASIETALTASGLFFERSCEYLDDEKCFETIYSVEV